MTTKGISKNSLIHTENGFKNVEDVVIGDCVLNENNELKARNEELEKENEKLHNIILNMTQKK